MNPYLLFVLLLSVSSYAQREPQISVREIKSYTTEARDLIKSFSLEGEVAPVGAPDYTLAKKLLLHNIQKKGPNLEKAFTALEDRLKPSYNNIKSIELLDGSKAEKATLKVAKERFRSQVKGQNRNYHEIIGDYILNDLESVYKSCLTVLCVNKINVDINKWIDHASKINRNLDLDYAKLEKYPNSDLRDDRKWINSKAADASRSLELTIPLNDPRCENLNDEVAVDDLLKFGTKLIADTEGGVGALWKKIEEERLKKEEEEKKKKADEANREEKRKLKEERRIERMKELNEYLDQLRDKTSIEIIKSLDKPVAGCRIKFDNGTKLYHVLIDGTVTANAFEEKDAIAAGPSGVIRYLQRACARIN